jgi:hypothetical protein
VAKALNWNGLDGEGRKLGEQPGLDKPLFLVRKRPLGSKRTFRDIMYEKEAINTPLVLAVNSARLVLQFLWETAVP